MRLRICLALCALLALAAGCKEDEPVANQPPDTKIFLDTIQLTGDNRLKSKVQLHWSGTDEDGYIVGYEISFDKETWDSVGVSDSTFNFDLAEGADSLDQDFYVRAIDNAGQRDPSPAHLVVPIKNSPPNLTINPDLTPADTLPIVLSVGWQASDPEGDNTLAAIELKVNDQPWYELPPATRLVSLVPTAPQSTGPTACEVFTGSDAEALAEPLDGLNLSGQNRLIFRARDEAGLTSAQDTLADIFVRRQTADLLVLDTWERNEDAQQFYRPMIAADSIYGSQDFYDISDQAKRPPAGNVTFRHLFGQYDKIFWYANSNALDYVMSRADVLQDHLNNKGKLVLFAEMNASVQNSNKVFEFTPAEELARTGPPALMNNSDAQLHPSSNGTGSYPTIANQNQFFIEGVVPFQAKQSAEIIYKADLEEGDGTDWPAERNIMARIRAENNRTNFIYSSLSLHQLSNKPKTRAALQQIFEEIDW
jgi:hypothetical protein